MVFGLVKCDNPNEVFILEEFVFGLNEFAWEFWE
jgi:hypothetical protein